MMYNSIMLSKARALHYMHAMEEPRFLIGAFPSLGNYWPVGTAYTLEEVKILTSFLKAMWPWPNILFQCGLVMA
ncbi:hypothetical protein FRX31_014717 [Thalictrum thalictroides]|uniref:Uncharacterized protein n=1 Tax=Thalictrum thalictroides TaxID=46969 RepID=A0A7J6WFQ8_THATH|nr:hypothetical protein FRX31_014717 [Thalictrum thalictroides]